MKITEASVVKEIKDLGLKVYKNKEGKRFVRKQDVKAVLAKISK